MIIVGAGPAGLSAALVLGRSRRAVLVFDDGKPRNAASLALHGYLTRDGISPGEFRRIAREQIAEYDSVRFTQTAVINVARTDAGFQVQSSDGESVFARKLLLAAGVTDALPSIEGFSEFYGAGVFHCPYCDGWEVRDQPLAVYGRGDSKGAGLALELMIWSRDVVLCTDGPADLSAEYRNRLIRYGIAIREERIVRLKPQDPSIDDASIFEIIFEGGPSLSRRALFFNTGRRQSTDLAERLGCEMYEEAGCKVDNMYQATNVPGLYIAGDASRDVLQAIVAAAEGAQAAIAINTALFKEEFP